MTDRHASAHRIRKGRSAVRQQGHHMTADRETVMSADTLGRLPHCAVPAPVMWCDAATRQRRNSFGCGLSAERSTWRDLRVGHECVCIAGQQVLAHRALCTKVIRVQDFLRTRGPRAGRGGGAVVVQARLREGFRGAWLRSDLSHVASPRYLGSTQLNGTT